MDNSSLPEKKVKRIIWKSSSREKFADKKDNCSSRTSRYDARKRRRSDPSQLPAALPKSNDSDSDAPKADDASMNVQHDLQNQQPFDPQEMSTVPTNNTEYGPCMMPLLPIPNLQECSSDLPIVLSGTASRGGTGPPVGAVDIGVSKCAYYFRVALPGVKKDPGEFSCEVERDGKVHVRGVTTTGARTVSRTS